MSPTVDFEFIDKQIKNSPSFLLDITVGTVTAYVKVGKSPLYKRTWYVVQNEKKQITFDQAIALSHHFSFLGELLKWLEVNRGFKDGGYFH